MLSVLTAAFTLTACSSNGDNGVAQSPGVLAFASATYSVSQGAGALTLTVNRSGGTIGGATVLYSTVDGSATAGVNFSSVSGSLSWSDGDSSAKTITIPISSATPFVGTKTFSVSLSSAAGASMGSPATTSVTINGIGNAGLITVGSAAYTVGQSAGTVTITVNRTGGSTDAASVDYTTKDGTAVSGTDYSSSNGTLTWASGDTASKTVSIAIANTTAFAGNRVFTLQLANAVKATLGTQATASVTIVGSGLTGAVAFVTATQTVSQGDGTIGITVNRTGGTNGAATANYTISNGTASSGTDFTAASTGVLSWADGDSAAKSISVSISNATPFTGTKAFSVALTSATGASLGTPTSTTITINGTGSTGSAGTIALASTSAAVGQAAGSVTITVNRSGGSVGAATVNYTTGNGTASAPNDYTAGSGTLSWASGNATAKTISIPISNTTPFVGTRSFTVVISGATGATLGTQTTAAVTISGSGNPGTLAFSTSTGTVGQAAGTVTLTVNRTGGTTGAASISYATNGTGTAVAGTHYTATNGVLNWANGESAAKTFTIAISNATPFTSTKTFGVALSTPTGATLGAPATQTVTINGSGSAGNAAFATASYATTQNAGTVTIAVNRNGGSLGAASVSYATVAGTATASSDYTSSSGTLSWADGDLTQKTITIALSSANPFVGTRSFTAVLSNPSGVTLATPSTTTVAIAGSGSAGTLALSAANYSVNQSAGTVTVYVTRTVGAIGAASVSYATGSTGDTAVANTDYTATVGVLNWADGDSAVKAINIPIRTANAFSGTKTLTVTLSSATGAALGSPAAAVVSIAGVSPTATLNWSAPSLNADGSAITDLQGYVIYYGTSPTNLNQTLVIATPDTTTAVVGGLTSGTTYYFAISSVSTTGGESARSDTISKTL